MTGTSVHSVGIIMNGVTGRMGLNQHLRRSIHAIMQQGGVLLGPGEAVMPRLRGLLPHQEFRTVALEPSEAIMPRPLLVGRNAVKLEAISAEFGGLPWTTDLD